MPIEPERPPGPSGADRERTEVGPDSSGPPDGDVDRTTTQAPRPGTSATVVSLSTLAAAVGDLHPGPAGGPSPTEAAEPLSRLPGFEVIRLLGRGSFASVYLARQLDLDRLVALKVAAAGGGEARTMASLEHPHIVQVFSQSIDP